MPTYDEAYPSRFVKPADLGDKRRIITIEIVYRELVYRSQKEPEAVVWVLYPAGWPKGIPLCKTSFLQLAEATGCANSDDWAGHKVIVLAEHQRNGKSGIRFHAVPGNTKPAE
ncbi:MAG: hypothetical protein A2Z04_06740 [Chloroflexi bacterium RBG_16_57_9]|nr:MAG: hypothetical protein A2Z04_06740 [Chloroflexi bacterium RBG_16_57_9]